MIFLNIDRACPVTAVACFSKTKFHKFVLQSKYIVIYIMLDDKVLISKHGETIITICSDENNYK